MEKVVIDTSVIAAALLSKRGGSYKLISLLANGRLEIIVSSEIMDEYFRVLLTKMTGFYSIEVLLEFYAFLESISRITEPEEQFDLCRDKDDNKFLNAVYASKANFLISLDKDLLDLRNESKDFQIKEHRFKILRPEEFLEMTAEGQI
ncbi:putative toxin-antitoxin system toxin component, PIN family [Geoglobus acetivorans]|uniref:Toxin-antitoxin system toxin component, PIN family n=1 Tax=Geoglobus acetivorans TaxID=565033 RepID=A0ABZ3H2Y0_GEOAI|nr:putative toxin-antitoxin system toxin component, PIN family [Geoglobus acetivorans]